MKPALPPLLALSLLLLAGCLSPALTTQIGNGEAAATRLEPDCGTGFEETDSGVCARFFRTTNGDEWEPHFAVHPTDPKILLLTSTRLPQPLVHPMVPLEDGPVAVWVAMSRDGGQTWKTHVFGDPFPVIRDVPGVTRYSFDSIAGFGGDGTAYILYGGENLYATFYASVRTQMTVARSTDLGATWTTHRFHDSPAGLEADDYMDMAVAPDLPHVYVAADTFSSEFNGIQFWRSLDKAQTWQAPKPLAENTHQFARTAAGANGLVVVTGFPYARTGSDYAGVDVWISRDAGATFKGPSRVAHVPLNFIDGMQPTIWHEPTSKTVRIDIGYSSDNKTYLVTSPDAGLTWGEPRLVSTAPDGHVANLYETAVGPDGTWYALERYGRSNVFGLNLISVTADGVITESELVNKTGIRGAPYAGGHYGGLAVSGENKVWAAWGDVRRSPVEIGLAGLRTVASAQ